jgi:coenzyme PQQ precursor peptide PqqA
MKTSRPRRRDQDPEGGRSPPATAEEATMKWTKPEVEVIELGMEIGAYAGSA